MILGRYSSRGTWWKGNTHIHSQFSDGGMAPAAIAELYAGAGYHFLFRTDHWSASGLEPASSEPPAPGTSASGRSVPAASAQAPLLWLPGIELDGKDRQGSYYHVVCLGRFAGMTRERGFSACLAQVQEQGGFTILAHPHWTGNTFDEALRHGFDGVEIYNHVCRWLNAKHDGLAFWDYMLRGQGQVLGIAADDAHLRPEHPGWNGGWIMVQAESCREDDIFDALRRGDFYSTQGPEFHRIQVSGDSLELEFSPASQVWLIGPQWSGQRQAAPEGQTLTHASFTLPDWPYCRVEIEDAQGRRAWTNPL